MASRGQDMGSLAPVNAPKDTRAVTVVHVCVSRGVQDNLRRRPAQDNHPAVFLHHQRNYKHGSPRRWNYLLPQKGPGHQPTG